MLAPAHVPCTLPEVFSQVKAGERIWFDDGRIGGIIRRVRKDHVQVEIVQCAAKGATLRSDKGINLPDSDLRLPALTTKDIEDLGFAVAHADLIGLSFVQREADVLELRHQLRAAGADHIGIILKIETRRAFERLAELTLAALQHPRSGIMIARGDLAVECGYERLAEVQEEILWVCEAAHLPVIWATQVLESLAKTGQPSRAEITTPQWESGPSV
jgi:pyruvate kinase